MSYPPFVWNNPATIEWRLRDAAGVPITGATVTATLWKSRDAEQPDTTPGTAITALTDLALAEDIADPGFYSIDLDADDIPGIDDYVLVVDAEDIGHWEEITSVIASAPTVPVLCTLGDFKEWLGIADDAQDRMWRRLIRSTSRDFLNRIRRPGFLPARDYVELIERRAWDADVLVRNYPVNSVAAVTLNDAAVPVYDPTLPDTLGWFFDFTRPPESRQGILLRGRNWRHLYQTRCGPMRISITYNGGYLEVPDDVTQAICEWVGFKKGLAQLQSKDQTSQSIYIGQYRQDQMVANSTYKASMVDMPESVAKVISVYECPVI